MLDYGVAPEGRHDQVGYFDRSGVIAVDSRMCAIRRSQWNERLAWCVRVIPGRSRTMVTLAENPEIPCLTISRGHRTRVWVAKAVKTLR